MRTARSVLVATIGLGVLWLIAAHEALSWIDWNACFDAAGMGRDYVGEPRIDSFTLAEQLRVITNRIADDLNETLVYVFPFFPLVVAASLSRAFWRRSLFLVLLFVAASSILVVDPSEAHDCDRKGTYGFGNLLVGYFLILPMSIILITIVTCLPFTRHRAERFRVRNA